MKNNKKNPYLIKWHGMLNRAYGITAPKCYDNVYVCDDWLEFSNFRKWMSKQDWQGKELDKDLKIKGNKIYSPETCMFVSHQVNSIMGIRLDKGKYPTGVYFSKERNKYQAQIRLYGKRKNLGRFDTVYEAEEAYIQAKKEYIMEIILYNPYNDSVEVLESLRQYI